MCYIPYLQRNEVRMNNLEWAKSYRDKAKENIELYPDDQALPGTLLFWERRVKELTDRYEKQTTEQQR
jgi:hypothetical protein